MPLSEHEERVLAEIERQLVADDPKFVARAQRRARSGGPGAMPPRRRLTAGILGVIVGIICVALLTVHVAFGIVGFLLLLGSLAVIVDAVRKRNVTHVQVIETDSRPDSRHD